MICANNATHYTSKLSKAVETNGMKHQMIVAVRGVLGRVFEPGEILEDTRAFHDADKHVKRILELINMLYP